MAKLVGGEGGEKGTKVGRGRGDRLPHSDEHSECLPDAPLHGVLGRERFEGAWGGARRLWGHDARAVPCGEVRGQLRVTGLVTFCLAAATDEALGGIQETEVALEEGERVDRSSLEKGHSGEAARDVPAGGSRAIGELLVPAPIDRARIRLAPHGSPGVRARAHARAAEIAAKVRAPDTAVPEAAGAKVSRERDEVRGGLADPLARRLCGVGRGDDAARAGGSAVGSRVAFGRPRGAARHHERERERGGEGPCEDATKDATKGGGVQGIRHVGRVSISRATAFGTPPRRTFLRPPYPST